MLVTVNFIFLCILKTSDGKLSPITLFHDNHSLECISEIVNKYFSRFSELTYVDFHSDDHEIIKALNSIPVVMRTELIKMSVPDESYLIVADKSSHVINDIPFLVKQASWNPHAKFLITAKNSNKNDLKEIFDTLLKYHINDVLVADADYDPNLYTYNPFENHGCGKQYERIIEFGKCSSSRSINLYPDKLITGLRRCQFQVVTPHWPPYAIDPSKTKETNVGVEEFIFRQISILEQFNVTFRYTDDAEIFTMVLNDMSAVGPLYLLQQREADVILGGMVLTHPRAKAFDYVYGHLSFTEDLRYQVKKSSNVPSWKNMYLEFHAIVWTVLVLTFLTYFVIFVILTKQKNKTQIVFKMFQTLFSGRTMKGKFLTKYLWIVWIIFAYLINVYYQSSLVSLTTNPLKNYQISNEKDLDIYNVKPCVSNVMRDYLLSVENVTFAKNEHKDCEKLLQSISTVSKSYDAFTLVLYSIYSYHENYFYDDWGNPTIYSFKQPVSKAVYAMYFYKGFPLLENITLHALRLRENGLIDKYLNRMQWKNRKQYFSEKPKTSSILMPWYILAGGYVMSTCVFFLELLTKKRCAKKTFHHDS